MLVNGQTYQASGDLVSLRSDHLRCRQFVCILLNAVKGQFHADTALPAKEVGNRESCASGSDGSATSGCLGAGSESLTAKETRIGQETLDSPTNYGRPTGSPGNLEQRLDHPIGTT